MIEQVSERTPGKRPSQNEMAHYFGKLGMRFREEFAALKQFRVFGKEARGEGWFIGYRALVQGALGLKLGELLNLSMEERALLTQAGLVNGATRRAQYEARGPGNISSEEFSAIENREQAKFIDLGIDPRAVEIGKASGTSFSARALNNEYPLPEPLITLARYLHYLHNCVDQKIVTDAAGVKSQEVDITSYEQHLREAETRYAKLREETQVVRGTPMRYFDIEILLCDETERELRERIRTAHPDLDIPEGKKIWQLLREDLFEDIRTGQMPGPYIF